MEDLVSNNESEILDEVDYGVDNCDFIRDKLAGYSGGVAIASELIQNADDATADIISFHFCSDALIVRNNRYFNEQDFKNIVAIASGGKREEPDKIGTWGTGFISVFHLTDYPELESSGKCITFDPTKRRLPRYPSQVQQETVFRLPWRIKSTELSQRLGADIWSTEQILELKNNLINDIYRLVLFLRHINVIEVYEGDTKPKLIARVERKKPTEYTNGAFTRLQRKIEYKRMGLQPRIDTWFYYCGQISTELYPTSITIKDSSMAIAFPQKTTEWLDKNVPAVLYNFLPTPINTGLSFQFNGAFFPDNNRQSILLDLTTQREKSAWNRQVLEQLGQLFARVALDMRDRVGEPRRFYELLPVSPSKQEFLELVRQPFIRNASKLPIVWTSLKSWEYSDKVFIGRRGSRLPELAANYLPILPTGVPQEFRDFLERELQSPTLNIIAILRHLRPYLKSGIPLASAHPMINRWSKLEMLYGEISIPVLESISDFADLAICLTENQTLWPFEEIWRTDKATRRLLAETDIQFIDIKMQKKFLTWLMKLVNEFKGAELVKWLTQQEWPDAGLLNTNTLTIASDRLKRFAGKLFQPSPIEHTGEIAPLSLTESPPFIRDAGHLAEILRFIAQDLSNVNQKTLSRLPLVRTEEGFLVNPTLAYRHDDAVERAKFKNLGLYFVYDDWSKDREIWSVYQYAGVKRLEVQHVIEVLPEAISKWKKLPTDELIKHLLTLYQYFVERIRHLNNKDKGKLRRLPLCITQKGRLVPAEGGDTTLQLSSARSSVADNQVGTHLDRLQLDNLVHSKLISQGKSFLIDVLLLEALSPARLIETVIIPHYLDPRLDDAARQDLLRYVSEQLRDMPENQQRALFPKLLNELLIQCEDSKYYSAQSVYFASPTLDTVFANGYHKLHPNYDVPVAQPDASDQTPYRHSIWYWLFEHLGVNERPMPSDLVDAVKRIVTVAPPGEAQVEAVQQIYEFLNREVGKRQPKQDGELKKLAELAWLPARNDDANWRKPAQLYQASHADFVGKQAPLLRFQESTIQLRRLLNMPAFPPVDIIANHLLASARENKKVERRVYDELGRRWTELSHPLQERSKNEAVVWGDGDKYWLANHVFSGDYRELFGRRRCYLNPPGGDAQKFLRQIGVKEKPDGWHDSIALLLEISDDYTDDRPAAEDDLRLLYRNFDHLGRQLLAGNNNIALHQLKGHKLVPAKDGYLYRANRIVLADQRDILDQFDPDAIPVVSESELTENAYHFLRQLGVSRLSQLIQRRPVDTGGSREDMKFSLQLQQLTPAFQRMALTYQEQNEAPATFDLPAERLRGVKLRICQKLVVGYELDNRDGWRAQGHNRPEEALYYTDDKDFNFLYVKQTKSAKIPFVALARELERILFPGNKESTTIEQLLKMPPAKVDSYLDEHRYRRVYQNKLSTNESDSEHPTLIEWDEAPETPVPDVPKFEDEQDQTDVGKDALIGDESAPTTQSKFDFDSPDEADIQNGPIELDKPIDDAMGKTGTSDFEITTGTKDVTQQPPPFTGQRWPISIRQPNDYARLSKEFGLPLNIGEDNGATKSSDDTEWEPAQPNEKEKDTTGDRPITTVRFTLKYQNRYEGFLALHSRARQMLADQPPILTCLTDYPDEWTFKLYVNYSNPGMIYNEDRLPQFFEAFNIPAGGIVYLERLEAHNTVRLFWKNVEQTVRDIKRYELMENGEVEEFLTDVIAPCEVNKHILRADTRLEDIGAFIKKSVGQPGVFELVCDAFGEANGELSYDDIFDYVQEKRPVSDFTIRAELYTHPCFVLVGDRIWHFEPVRGDTPTMPDREIVGHHPKTKSPTRDQGTGDSQQPEQPSSSDLPEPTLQQPAPSSEPPPPLLPPSPYQIVLKEAQQEWEALSDLFNLDGHDPADRLQELAEHLSQLVQRLQLSLTTLAQPVQETDDLLAAVWQDLNKNVADKETQRKLQQYLQEKFTQEKNEPLLLQLSQLLVRTASQHRELVFFPILSDIAQQLAENAKVAPSRRLYQLLQEQGAGDFQTQLQQLQKYDEVQEYIDLAQIAETTDERWELWREAWQKYPDFPTLRQAIQKGVKTSVDNARQAIESNLGQGKSQDAFEIYLKLIEQIAPLVDAWQTAQKVSPLIWGLAQRLFETLQGVKAYRQALQVVASLPPKTSWNLSGDIYLEAIQGMANEFEQADNLAAVALMDYGIYCVKENDWPTDNYVLSNAYEYAGRLYENLAMPHRAYNFISKAHRKATGERKTQLGQRAYALNQQRDKTKEQAEAQNRQTQIEVLPQNPDFSQLVNLEIFRSFCNRK